MRQSLLDRTIRRLTPDELRRAAESINHGLGKPEPALLPILIDGHHQIDHEHAQRIKSILRGLTAQELTWIADNVEKLVPDD